MQCLSGICTEPPLTYDDGKVHVTGGFEMLIELRVHVMPERLVQLLSRYNDIRKLLNLTIHTARQRAVAVEVKIRDPQLL